MTFCFFDVQYIHNYLNVQNIFIVHIILNMQLKNTYIINDLAALQVISDPLRLSIFLQIRRDNLEGKLSSARQLARQLKISQTKLYYHLKMMEQHRFIEVGETRTVSGIPEKWYQTTSPHLVVSDRLLGGERLLFRFASGMFNHSLDEMENTIQSAHDEGRAPDSNLLRQISRLSPQRAREFNQKLEKLIEEFSETNDVEESEEMKTYVLMMALYPLTKGPADEPKPGSEPA